MSSGALRFAPSTEAGALARPPSAPLHCSAVGAGRLIGPGEQSRGSAVTAAARDDIVLQLGLSFLNDLLMVIAEQFAAMPDAAFDIDDVQVEQFELAGLLHADLMGSGLGITRCLVRTPQPADGRADDEAMARGDVVVWLRDAFLLDRVARGAIWHASTIGPVALKWVNAQRLCASARLRVLPQLPAVPPTDVWVCTGRPLAEIIGQTEVGQDSDVVVRFGNGHLGEVLAGIMADPSSADGPVRIENPRVEVSRQGFEARFDARWWWSRTPCLTRLIPRMIDDRLQIETLDFAIRGLSLTNLPSSAGRWVREHLDDRFERTVSRKADPWISRPLPPLIGEYVCEITDVDSVEGGWAIFAAIRGLRPPDRAWMDEDASAP